MAIHTLTELLRVVVESSDIPNFQSKLPAIKELINATSSISIISLIFFLD
jgi:hypothetical protein